MRICNSNLLPTTRKKKHQQNIPIKPTSWYDMPDLHGPMIFKGRLRLNDLNFFVFHYINHTQFRKYNIKKQESNK